MNFNTSIFCKLAIPALFMGGLTTAFAADANIRLLFVGDAIVHDQLQKDMSKSDKGFLAARSKLLKPGHSRTGRTVTTLCAESSGP